MLTYTEYAHRYGYRRPYEVLKLIEKQRIQGVREDARCKYLVPEEALPDYSLPAKRDRTAVDIAFHLIKALNTGRNINARILRVSNDRYNELVDALVNEGLICRNCPELPCKSGLSLTGAGMEVAQKKKYDFTRWARLGLVAIIEGIVRAQQVIPNP